MTLGDSCFGVDVNPSGGSRIVDIRRRAADPIEASGGEDPPVEIVRRKAQTMTDIKAGAEGTAKAAALSGRRVPRLVTCGHVAAAPRATAPNATSRWRRPAGLQAASTRSYPRGPRPFAAPLGTHVGAPRHPVLTPLRHVILSHQTRPQPSTPAFAHSNPRGTPCTVRLDGSPSARNRARRRRKCSSQAPRCMHRHTSAARPRHARRAQRALQHRRFGYNILWRGTSVIARTG